MTQVLGKTTAVVLSNHSIKRKARFAMSSRSGYPRRADDFVDLAPSTGNGTLTTLKVINTVKS